MSIYAVTCPTIVREDILFYVEYTMFCINIPICIAIVGFYAWIAKEIKKRNMRLKDCMKLKEGVNYRTIIFCMAMSSLFVITYLPSSLSVIIYKEYLLNDHFIYLYLVALLIDPSMFIAKRIFEKRCCNGNDGNSSKASETQA